MSFNRGGYRGGHAGHGGKRDDSNIRNQALREVTDHSALTNLVGNLARLGDSYIVDPSLPVTSTNPHHFVVEIPSCESANNRAPVLGVCYGQSIPISGQINLLGDFVNRLLPAETKEFNEGIIQCVSAMPTKIYLYAQLVAFVHKQHLGVVEDLRRRLMGTIQTTLQAIVENCTSNNLASENAATVLHAFAQSERTTSPARALTLHRTLAALIRFVGALACSRVFSYNNYFSLLVELFEQSGVNVCSKDHTSSALFHARTSPINVGQSAPDRDAVSCTTRYATLTSGRIVCTPLADSMVHAALSSLLFSMSSAQPHTDEAYVHASIPSEVSTLDFDTPLMEDDDTLLVEEAALLGEDVQAMVSARRAQFRAVVSAAHAYLTLRNAHHCGVQFPGRPVDDLTWLFESLVGCSLREYDGNAGAFLTRPLAVVANGSQQRRASQRAMIALRKSSEYPVSGAISVSVSVPLFTQVYQFGEDFILPSVDILFVSAPLQAPPVLPLAKPSTVQPIDQWQSQDYAVTLLSTYESALGHQVLQLLTLPSVTMSLGRTQACALQDTITRLESQGHTKEHATYLTSYPSYCTTQSHCTAPQPEAVQQVVYALVRCLLCYSFRAGRAQLTDSADPVLATLSDVSIPHRPLIVRLLKDMIHIKQVRAQTTSQLGPVCNAIFTNIAVLPVYARTNFADALAMYLSFAGIQWFWGLWEKAFDSTLAQPLLTPTTSFFKRLFSQLALYVPVETMLEVRPELQRYPFLPVPAVIHNTLMQHSHKVAATDCKLCRCKDIVGSLASLLRNSDSSQTVLHAVLDKKALLEELHTTMLTLVPMTFTSSTAAHNHTWSTMTSSEAYSAIDSTLLCADKVHPFLLPQFCAYLQNAHSCTHIHTILEKYAPLLCALANCYGAGVDLQSSEQQLIVVSANNNANTLFAATRDGTVAVPDVAHVAIQQLTASMFRADATLLTATVKTMLLFNLVSAPSVVYWSTHFIPKSRLFNAALISCPAYSVLNEVVSAVLMSFTDVLVSSKRYADKHGAKTPAQAFQATLLALQVVVQCAHASFERLAELRSHPVDYLEDSTNASALVDTVDEVATRLINSMGILGVLGANSRFVDLVNEAFQY